jgi:hypothetical protein
LDDLFDAATEVVHPRCEEKASTADPGRATTDLHPVATHAVHESGRVQGDFLGLVAEIEQGGETSDVDDGVDDGDVDGEFADEFQVGRAEGKNVDLAPYVGVLRQSSVDV